MDDKKEISANTTVKAIITGFASYGIIFYFIIVVAGVASLNILENTGNMTNTKSIIFSIIMAIISFFIIRLICRVSTLDVFKKCKTNPENYKAINSKLIVFYIVFICFSAIVGFTVLRLNIKNEMLDLKKGMLLDETVLSEDFAEELYNDRLEKLQDKKYIMIIQSIVVEIGVCVGFLSLIKYQQKMLDRYNNYTETKKQEESNQNEYSYEWENEDKQEVQENIEHTEG